MSRVLVVSPHPDDEAIGCGGTLRKHVEQGDAVRAVFLTSGEKGGHGRPPEETARRREQEAATAAAVLGVAEIEFWRGPDGAFRATRGWVDRLRSTLEQWRPEVLYVTHAREMHPDHRAAARMARRARLAAAHVTHVTVLAYEVWTPMERMDEIVDISPYVEVKRKAIRAYRSQCAVMRFEEAALALNRYRGEMHCWPGGDYAESFTRL
jgi:LmbE family N-acetylglucosaminyl deacetylase